VRKSVNRNRTENRMCLNAYCLRGNRIVACTSNFMCVMYTHTHTHTYESPCTLNCRTFQFKALIYNNNCHNRYYFYSKYYFSIQLSLINFLLEYLYYFVKVCFIFLWAVCVFIRLRQFRIMTSCSVKQKSNVHSDSR